MTKHPPIPAPDEIPVIVTSVEAFGTAAQDNGNGIVRFNSSASRFNKLSVKRGDLLRISYNVGDRPERKILAIFRDNRKQEGEKVALEYDQCIQLFVKSAPCEEISVGIKIVRTFPNICFYLWDHPNIGVKYNFRFSVFNGAALTVAGVIIGYAFSKWF